MPPTAATDQNILFIMCDQLRFDYLSCYGHQSLMTPNIDLLADRGVRFTRAYVQSPICGPSRMSFYTGRYVRSHGSTWNSAPLRVGEMTLGDHLRPLGLKVALCGKTHMVADQPGMARLGVEADGVIGARVAECGFDVWDRLDGVHPDGGKAPSHYNAYLNQRGYQGENPWQNWANAVEAADGSIGSGWLLENADKPARVREEDTETAYTTTRAIEFIARHRDRPWCLHLSYIKPHWPYVVAEPYASLYGPEDIQPPVRSKAELRAPHPALAAFQKMRASDVFARDEVRTRVIPAYMGLIKQIDDHLGRVYRALKDTGQWDRTMIVFTSDHGDYLGDHWMGEKEFFHDASAKIPLIIVDPSPNADATRGTACDHLVEAIDLLPTFVEHLGGAVPGHVLEGRSLIPLLQGNQQGALRDVAISEYDFSYRQVREALDLDIADSAAFMVFDGRYKAIFFRGGIGPILFDLETDPEEFTDIARTKGAEPVLRGLRDRLLDWATRPHNRVTTSDAHIEANTGTEIFYGVKIGCWNEDEVETAMTKDWESTRKRFL